MKQLEIFSLQDYGNLFYFVNLNTTISIEQLIVFIFNFAICSIMYDTVFLFYFILNIFIYDDKLYGKCS